MRIDPLIRLNEAINAALEAAVVPAVLVLGALVVIAATIELHDRVRRRRQQPRKRMQVSPKTRVKGVRGAET